MACAELLMVPPDAFSPFFPMDSIHISAYHFVNASLPPRSSGIITGHTDFWFSFPPMHFVNQLKAALGFYWLQGNQSIVDPQNGKSDRFPFYVLEFWTQVTEVRETQMHWGQAIKYVECQKHSASDRDHIDLMVGHMNLRLKLHGAKSTRQFMIAPLAFTNKLMNPVIYKALRKGRNVEDTVLKHFETVIIEDRIDILYAPLHVNGNHWIAIALDFNRGEVFYGDSLGKSCPFTFLQKVDLWLCKRFNHKFADKGFLIECGVQRDSFSCGICVVNAILHAVFSDTLWCPDLALVHHMQWFIDLCADCPSVAAITSSSPSMSNLLPLANPLPTQSGSMCLGLADLLNPIASIPSSNYEAGEVSDSDCNADFETAYGSSEDGFGYHQ
ncbi:hypothetical protein F5876DRAFT_75460 [Lentinula aff. lateritia]|uniref:Uncharacterized protein n=1 Tax=Lentinula aff. lateritia TaxID=2804960 RepID=A0ACC1U4B3_9AGAR|nr:hypothetical protein F5876DRAFT_75460 [Lentinula aff. lateritia]